MAFFFPLFFALPPRRKKPASQAWHRLAGRRSRKRRFSSVLWEQRVWASAYPVAPPRNLASTSVMSSQAPSLQKLDLRWLLENTTMKHEHSFSCLLWTVSIVFLILKCRWEIRLWRWTAWISPAWTTKRWIFHHVKNLILSFYPKHNSNMKASVITINVGRSPTTGRVWSVLYSLSCEPQPKNVSPAKMVKNLDYWYLLVFASDDFTSWWITYTVIINIFHLAFIISKMNPIIEIFCNYIHRLWGSWRAAGVWLLLFSQEP